MAGKRGFGSIRKLPSGRYQARYTGPDGSTVTATTTFTAKIDAEAWLMAERREVERSEPWMPPVARLEAARKAAELARKPSFASYADTWIRTRKVKGGRPLQPSTVRGYRIWLRKYLEPAFGGTPIDEITPGMMIGWHESMEQGKAKTLREAYALGSAIMRTATAADGPIAGHLNPFAIDGAGSIGAASDKREELVEDAELPVILATIRAEWQALVWLALGCGLRFGEGTALRCTRDFDLRATPPVVKVRHAIGTETGGRQYEKPPKSRAGVRDQRIPAAVLAPLKVHLRTYVSGRDGLLFPAPGRGWLTSSRFHESVGGWRDVREALERPKLNFHDLRATGATRMALAGANVAEIQTFLGDSTPTAAMRYVRAAQSRMDHLTTTAFASLTSLGTG